MSHLYGTTHVKVENDIVDRIGIRTLILSKFWVPSRGGLSQEALDAEAPPIPSVPGGMLLIGEQTRQVSGGLRTAWTFEGIKGNGKTVTFKGRKDSLDYGFEPGFTQAAIQHHPDYQYMLFAYGGFVDNEGRVIFPPTMPVLSQASGFGLSAPGERGTPNPMHGHDEFFRMEGSYRFRYAATSIPIEARTRIGRSMPSGSLPGEPPVYEDRDWLKLPVVWKRRGFIYEAIEMYWLSGEGGWPEPIYNYKR